MAGDIVGRLTMLLVNYELNVEIFGLSLLLFAYNYDLLQRKGLEILSRGEFWRNGNMFSENTLVSYY